MLLAENILQTNGLKVDHFKLFSKLMESLNFFAVDFTMLRCQLDLKINNFIRIQKLLYSFVFLNNLYELATHANCMAFKGCKCY